MTTDEQLNLAMCEWMGWKKTGSATLPWTDGDDIWTELPPNYLSDHSPRRLLEEAEARLTKEQQPRYVDALWRITQHTRIFASVSASARQRVIAILKTVKPELFK